MTEAEGKITENTNITAPDNFIKEAVRDDLKSGRFTGPVATRFPPEPNGYLHIGHAKALCIDFGIAEEFNGKCNLRFDDTNAAKEEVEYVESIQADVKWLGFDWEDRLFFASDYFEQMFEWACQLIRDGKAYVCNLTPEEVTKNRGTLTQPGVESPYRNRSASENLELFHKMRSGEFPDGACTLRAKIDMSHPNINMRDPVMYRIQHKEHHRTGNRWCIYPMYDWAHGLEDSIEKITHSLCSLEYEDHRPLYDWFLDQLEIYHPRQIEFARLNMTHTVMSKRKLLELVKQGIVSGWDDPRMPTLAAYRRRGYTPSSIRKFCEKIGVAKSNSTVDIALLEHCIREELNASAQRVMVVLNPLKVVIENYPENHIEELEAQNNPEDPSAGVRMLPFSREIYIEQDDFCENPPKKFFRLAPGKEIRLKHAYYITCRDVVKDSSGQITELRCSYDPESKGGTTPDGRKVQGTCHWVSSGHAVSVEVRLYDHLFSCGDPDHAEEGKTFLDFVNPDSKKIISSALAEKSLKNVAVGDRFQFMRQGYFAADPDFTSEKPVFNRIVALSDSWAKIVKKMDQSA